MNILCSHPVTRRVMGDTFDVQTDLANAIDLGAKEAFPIYSRDETAYIRRSSFIHSVSSLSLTARQYDLSENLCNRNLTLSNETPFQSYFAEKSRNLGHVAVTIESAAWVRQEIAGQPQPPTTCGAIVSPPLPNGCYTLKAKHSNLFIQPENNNTGARLRQYDANGQTNQIFNLEWVDNNAYRINSQSAAKIVEAAGGGTANRTPVVLGDWSNANHQKWNVEAWGDGSYKLSTRNASTQLFDIEGTSVNSGAGVHLWAQHGADNQRFILQSTSCAGGPPPPPGGCVINRVRFKFRNVGDCCMDRLVGAKIQGSSNQSTWADLYTFTANGTGDWQEVTFGNSTSYPYVRFQASSTGYGELYELEFYNGSTKLNGTAFGTSGVDASTGYASAFDGNINTWWHAVFPGTTNYAGLNLSGCGGGARVSASEAAAEEAGPEGLLLVPNPASEYVELRLPTGEQVRRAVCYDVQGRALIETTHARLYTGRLAGGTYLIRVETKAGRTYSRVLVKL